MVPKSFSPHSAGSGSFSGTRQAPRWRKAVFSLLVVLARSPSVLAAETPAALDQSFDAAPGPNDVVRAVLVEPDGKVVIGGGFTQIGENPRSSIARLLSDGRLDPSFQPTGLMGSVYAMARRPDGRILVGGSLTKANGSFAGISQMTVAGTVDPAFTPVANGPVWSLALQPDGKVLLGGDFSQVNGVATGSLARLHVDGTLDASFQSSPTVQLLRSVKVLETGQILIAGNFTSIGGVSRNRIARLSNGGALDLSFNPGRGADSWVSTLAVQPDGRILMGGGFRSVDGVRRTRLARLHGDGTLDLSFDPGMGANESVTSIALESGGKVVATGGFTTVDGLPRLRVARFYPNGELDPFFDSSQAASDWVESVAIQADGRILVAGAFLTINQAAHVHIARLQGGDPAPSAPIIAATLQAITIDAGRALMFRAQARATPQPVYRWFHNEVEIVGATRDAFRIPNVGVADAGSYRVEVENSLGLAAAPIAAVTVVSGPTDPGSPDLAFYAGSGPSGPVTALAIQPDDKVLVGGAFDAVDDLPHAGVARLQRDGGLDQTFAAALGTVRAVIPKPNGRVLVGGSLGGGNPATVLMAAQLNGDGSLDPAFQPFAASPQSVLFDMLLLPDEKVLLGGDLSFLAAQGLRISPLARLQSNGILDLTFNLGFFPPGSVVYAMAREPDNQMLIGGFFTSVGGLARTHLARINPDGSVDPSFNPTAVPNGSVRAIALQGDGKVVVAGRFTRIGNVVRTRVARLHGDGSLDPSFDAGPFPAADDITALALQGDGKVLFGTSFDDGTFAVARLHSDGSLDGAFRTVALPNSPSRGPFGRIDDIKVLDDGKVLVGGVFTVTNVFPRARVARLFGGDPPSAAPSLLSVPVDRAVMAGRDVTFRVVVSSASLPSYQWQFEGMDLPGENRSYLTVRNVRYAHGGLYSVAVRNTVGATTSAPARLSILQPPLNAGAPDIGFYSGSGPNERVHAVVIQPDRKVLIAGAFTEVDGQSRNRIARLERNGALDLGFNPGTGADNTIRAMAMQSDGKILIAGSFLTVNGAPRSHLARLNPNGTLDSTFTANANADVAALRLQADGRIVIGGAFQTVNGSSRLGLTRLTADGALDPTGSLSAPAINILSLAIEPDNSILAGGDFANGPRVVRLLPSGVMDLSFNTGQGTLNQVLAMAVAADAQILIGGSFAQVDVTAKPFLARLTRTGSVVASFSPMLDGPVATVALQPNQQILAGGSFASVAGRTSLRLARLNSDGTADASFNVGEGFADGTPVIDEYGEYGDILKDAAVLAIAPEGAESAVIGGNFTTVNGAGRPHVARVYLRDGSTLDHDADGLPDWWELQYGLDAYSAIDPHGGTSDSDGDGHSNRIEFINGTNPVRGDSVEPVITVTETSTEIFTLQFATLRDRLYRIHFSPDLKQPFAPITPPIAGTGGMVSWTDDGTQTGGNPMPHRFYKLKVELLSPAP